MHQVHVFFLFFFSLLLACCLHYFFFFSWSVYFHWCLLLGKTHTKKEKELKQSNTTSLKQRSEYWCTSPSFRLGEGGGLYWVWPWQLLWCTWLAPAPRSLRPWLPVLQECKHLGSNGWHHWRTVSCWRLLCPGYVTIFSPYNLSRFIADCGNFGLLSLRKGTTLAIWYVLG